MSPAATPLQLRSALLQHTSLSEEGLAQALKKQEQSGRRLTDLLLELELVPEGELIGALASLYGIPTRETLAPEDIDAELATQVPISFAKHHFVLPIRRDGEKLEVAISDPLLTDPLDDMRMVFAGARCEPVLVTRRAILNCINHVYDTASSAEDVAEEFAESDLADIASELISEPEDLLDSSEESAPIIRLVNSLLQQAVKERASDIHIEPQEKELVVRYRIDDLLHEPIRPLPRRMQQAIVTRIKIMGRLDIAEKRLPQDGRIVLKIAGRDYDVRLSTLPTQYGERCVLRLLPRTQELLSIEKIGLSKSHQETLRKLIRRNNGIVLVTGPTGSGKTNTLYAALADINKPDKNIITIEDPVEIRLPGISQIEVKSAIGLTFAAGLRSILRQNPNIILVGEIRDAETAEIAIQSALTGHLVFSTLHTNDAAGAVARLLEMGVESYLLASSLLGVLAQRLVRRVCRKCMEPVEMPPELWREIGGREGEPPRAVIGRGCEECAQTGYHGREGIYEFLHVTDEIKTLVLERASAGKIKEAAVQQGMRTLRDDGWRSVRAGVTTVAEVVRVTQDEV